MERPPRAEPDAVEPAQAAGSGGLRAADVETLAPDPCEAIAGGDDVEPSAVLDVPDSDVLAREVGRGHAAPADWQRDLVRSRMFPRIEQAPRIGRYRVLRKLGRGGMGTVVAAHDETLDRRVALKLLHDDLAGKPRQRHRLLREAQAMARVSHPNVVTVYEADVFEDQLYIAMELVDGLTLDAWQRKAVRSWRECFDAYVQAGRGLEAAHAQSLVHRDFKPGNCIIDASGRVRVLDFGLARDATHGPVPSELTAASHSSVLSTSITVTGAMLGTIAYMSPEQLQGKPADARSDQFSFCVSMWEALCGQRPFVAETAGELLAAILQQRLAPVPKSRRGVPRWLRKILRQGLALHPADRHASMTELLRRLEAVPRQRRRLVLGAVGAGLLATVGLVSAQLAGPAESPCAELRERPPAGWDEATRDAVEQAILGTGLTDAAAIWGGVADHLDAYASEWSAERAALCESGGLEPRAQTAAQLARRSCLDDRARFLGALSGSLAHADRRTAAHAVSAAEALPPVAECRDAAQVIERPTVPEALQPAIDEVLERTARVFVLERLGRFEEGLALAEGTLASARALAERHEPPLAEILLAQGRLMRRSLRYAPAEAALVEALKVAERGQDDRRTEDVLHELVLLMIEQRRLPEAKVWFVQAESKVGRVGDRLLRDLWLAHDEARLARASGELELAAARLQQVVDGYGALPHASSRRSDALTTLALVREDQGRHEEARQLYEEALGGFRRHGDLQGAAEATYDLAGLYLGLDRAPEAVEAYERALTLFEASHGDGSPLMGSAHFGLANALYRQGRLDAALEHAVAAEARLREGDSTEDRLWALVLVANIHQVERRFDRALEAFMRAEAVAAAADGIDPELRASVIGGVGENLMSLGRLDEAEPRQLQALAILEEHVGERSAALVFALAGIGRLRSIQQRLPEARVVLERAWALQAEHEDRNTSAMIAWLLAEVCWKLGDAPTARTLTAEARRLYQELGNTEQLQDIDEVLRACGSKCQ